MGLHGVICFIHDNTTMIHLFCFLFGETGTNSMSHQEAEVNSILLGDMPSHQGKSHTGGHGHGHQPAQVAQESANHSLQGLSQGGWRGLQGMSNLSFKFQLHS